MKTVLRKLTMAVVTMLLLAICFATAVPAAAEEAETGETTVTWESGFVRNTANASMAEGSLQANASFSRTELIYVSSADVTVSWWAPYWYANTVQYVSIRDAEDAYVSCGMAGTDSASSVRETRNGVNGCIYSYTTTSECYLRISVYAGSTGFVASTMNTYASTLTYTLGANATENAFVCPADEIPENPTLDTSAADDLAEEQKAMLFEAVERYGVTDQATFDALCEVASAFTYEGIAARVQKGVGIRSLYTVNHTVLDASSADRITYGAIMGVGEYKGVFVNKTTDLAVQQDASKGYTPTSKNSGVTVVYDSEGASYATEKYAKKEDGLYTFAFTTVFGDSSMSPLLLRETELVYRGFIAVTVGDNTYILYADASGDTFGREDATYGAATSLLEVSDYFRYTYTDPETSEKVYATNVLLKENIAAAMDTAFVFTAADFATSDDDGSVANGESTYYAAETDGEGNVRFAETLVMKTGTANKLTLTVEAAREGFYRVAMKGNTLGSQIHYIYWKNTSLKTRIKQYQNGTRLAANTSRRTNYGTALGDTWANLYTIQDSFRVIPTLEETHKDTGEIYLSEGKNVISFWISSSVSASNYRASYFGLSELSFTLENELDADAIEIATYNGSVYADGYDKVSSSSVGTYPNTDTTLALSKSNDAGLTLNLNGSYANRVWYKVTVERSGFYELFLAYGGYAATYEILDGKNEVIHSHSVPKDPITSATHSTAVTYASAGEIYLAAGDYTVRLRLNSGSHGLLQGFFFSPTDEASHYKLTVHYVYENGEKAKDSLVAEYEKGVSYSVESPVIPGYKPSVAVVEGTANADRVVTVTYTENRVALTFTPVDPNGNAINGVSLGTLSVLAGNAYEYTLPTIDGYLVRETALSGTAGYSDESIPVTLYDAYYDYSVSGGTITAGTALDTVDGTLDTRLLAAGTSTNYTAGDGVTLRITPDVSGAYAIYGVINTAGGRADVRARNAISLWNGKYTVGRVAGSTTATYTFTESDFRVATGTAETLLAYQYLEAGKENVVTVHFYDARAGITVDGSKKGYVGLSSLSLSLVTPEFETADHEHIVTKSKAETTCSSSGVEFTDCTLIRNYTDAWAEYDLTVNRTGIYDLYGLISVQNAGATTLLLTNKSTGKETPLVFNAKKVIQLGGKSTSSTETAMIEGMTLYKGEYTVRITTASGYFAFSMLRFNFVSDIETGSTAEGEYATTVEDKLVTVNANYYPGFTRKAVTFSEDDGNVTYDPLFIALLNQYGFRGTFNLMAAKSDYSIYAGHEIANHGCHEDGIKTTAASPYTLSTVLTKIKSMSSQLNSGIAANGNTRHDKVLSFVHPFTSGYRFESTKVYTDEAELASLASLFTAVGKTEYTAQKLGTMMEKDIFYAYLDAIGIKANRYLPSSSAYGATTNFDLPDSFMYWRPTMHQSQLKNTAQDGSYSNTYTNAFRDLTDDGKLKLLYIWGHSFELVNEQYPTSSASATIKEADLIAFLNAFSGDEYYKDTVLGIREYVDATRSLIVSDGTVYNPSDVTVYLTVSVEGGEDERVVLGAGETYKVTFAETELPIDDERVSYSSSLGVIEATDGTDKSLVWQPSNTITFNLTSMREGYYAVYAKLNATHGYISETTLTNKTASDLKSEALNAVKTENTAWSGYTTGGRIKDYKGGTAKHSYDSASLDQYKVASDNGYVLVGYQYLIEGSNKITVSTNDSTVGVSSFKFSAVAEIPSDAIHILSGTYSYANKNNAATLTTMHNNIWMNQGATVQYTVNIPTDGEYALYMMAGGNNPGVEIRDGAGWELKTAANGTLQVGGASQSHVAFALHDALMLASGEATITLTCSGGYGKYAMITLVRVGEYVEPDAEFNVRGFTHDLSAGTASATVSLLAPDVYGAVLAICDLNGNILGYDALVKGYDVGGMEELLSVTLTDVDDITAAAGVKVFTVTEATLAEIESDALTREIAEEFEYRTVDGVRLLIVSDEHYAIGKTTRVGPLTGKTYKTGSTNSNSKAETDEIGQHNNYGYDSEQHIQAMIDAIKKEYAKQPFDAVMYLGDMTDMDYWYKRIYKNPTAFLSDTNGDGTVDFEDFYKSDYDEIYYVKTEYYNQLLSFDSDGDGENDASLPFFMTLGNHDVYKDEWFFDLTKPTADYEIGTTVEVADGISVCYVSEVDYAVMFEKNGEKDTAFFMVASHRTAGIPLERYLSGDAENLAQISADATLLAEMKESVAALLEVSKDYRQVFIGCHMLGDAHFMEFIEADPRIRAIYMGDSHVEATTAIGSTGVYNVNDGCFVHSFGTQYGFSYNFAAEPWAYLMLETHGSVSEVYRVNPDATYEISMDRFFRYDDESIRATAYSDELEAAILAMLNEKGGTSYATLATARSAGAISKYSSDVTALVRAEFLTRLDAAWTALGLIDENTTDAEKAKMIRYDATSTDSVPIGHVTHALMFAETVAKLGENAPGEIVKTADGILQYVITYRTYEKVNLYRGIGMIPTEN